MAGGHDNGHDNHAGHNGHGTRSTVATPPTPEELRRRKLETRQRVRGDREVVVGELLGVGADVLTVRIDGGGQDVLYVALSGVIECSILGSG